MEWRGLCTVVLWSERLSHAQGCPPPPSSLIWALRPARVVKLGSLNCLLVFDRSEDFRKVMQMVVWQRCPNTFLSIGQQWGEVLSVEFVDGKSFEAGWHRIPWSLGTSPVASPDALAESEVMLRPVVPPEGGGRLVPVSEVPLLETPCGRGVCDLSHSKMRIVLDEEMQEDLGCHEVVGDSCGLGQCCGQGSVDVGGEGLEAGLWAIAFGDGWVSWFWGGVRQFYRADQPPGWVEWLIRQNFDRAEPNQNNDGRSINDHLESKTRTKSKRKEDPVKVVYISTPMKVSASASKFREIVQELTGQDSDVVRIMDEVQNARGTWFVADDRKQWV
ncbi:hypothetical protein Dimus_027467 [Dionaea muscipula]